MDSGFSNMLENTRKYFQGIPTDVASTAAAAAAAAAAAQLHFPPPMPPSHHLHHNGGGGGRSSMNSSSSSSSSSSEPSSAAATDRFPGYHHPHLRYNFQPYSSPGHYPRTAVDPKPAAYQHHHFQPPSSLQYHHQQQQQPQQQQQQQHHHQLPPSASSSSPPSPYKSPYTLQPLQPPPLTVKQQQQQQQPPPSQFKPMSAARSSPPVSAAGKQYSPPKPPQSPYAVVPKPTSGAPQPQSPFTAPKEQQPSVPETPPPSPHSSHYYNRTTHSGLQQQTIDRDYLRFKPIQTPPPPPNRFQPLERPKSEVPVTSGTGLQSSHLAIRYDPKLEQPRSGVRAVPIAQAKQPSSSSSSTTAAAQHDVNRVIVQKPEPLRYNHQQQQQQHQQQQQQQQQQQHQHQLNNNHPHRSSTLSDDHHNHHQKRPASVQPSYLESRPFQIKPYDGGNNNSNGSSSNGSSGSGQSSSASSYHRPFTVAPQPLPPSSQASAAIIVSSMDHHRWAAFDGRAPPSFLQQQSSSSSAAAVINGYHHHHRPPPPTSSSLPATVVSQHHQHHSLSRQQQQSQHYPLNLHKLTQPARPATAAGQLQQPVKSGQENKTAKLRFETTKRESPLDLSVKTVCRSADSTDDRLNPFGHDIPKVNFKPDFHRSLPCTATAVPPQTAVVVGGQQHQQHNNANNAATSAYNHHHQFAPQISFSLPPPTPLPPPPPTVVVVQSSPQQPLPSVASAPTTPLPPIVRAHHHPHDNSHQVPPLSSADEAWRAAIDRQIEQKFNSYTSSKKHHPHPLHQYQQLPQHQHLHHPIPPTAMQQQQPPPPPPPQQGPAQADKRVLEILKQNIEARDQSSRPQIAEAPSTPAMVFSTPIRKEPSTTPLKKTDYYMAERTAVTPFPKKIDYYMDRAYCNAPRIRTKAERKQISAEESSSGTRMSSPMAAATAISPHPFLPSNNGAPQTKQEPTPLTLTEEVIDLKLDIKREPSPIKEADLSSLTKEEPEKDEDDEDFWMNTCNSFVVQLAETQEKKKVKTPVKRKSAKELQPQPPKRKYTKRIKIGPITETDKDNKSSDVQSTPKSAEEEKLENSPLSGNVICEETSQKDAEPLDMDKENKTKLEDLEKTVDDTKNKEDNEEKSAKGKPRKKRLFKPLIAKVKKIKKEHKKELKLKELKKESKKEEKKELKKAEKKDKETVKKEQLPKLEKKELAAVAKEEKKGLKKEEKLKKDQQQPDHGNKKDFNKKEGKKTEAARKKVVVEKENLTKNTENTSRRSAAAAAIEVAGKINPRQSLRRKNSLKDYSFAFDELLDDAFAHFETVKIPVKRRRKCASPSPSPAPTVVAAAVGATQVIAVVKKAKEKDNETIRMRLRSRNRPLQAKQEPQQTSSKNKANAKNKIIPKRRRKKSLGEKSAHAATVVSTTEDWKDELYKFKRSLRLPSKLISVVSPPTAGAVAADQVSLTSIMNIPPHSKPAKESKAAKLAACQSLQAVGLGALNGKNKPKRLGGHMFGRRDVMFKGRRLMKREKIVSAEKLMQRNLRKRRQREDEVMKKGCTGEEVTASHLDDEDEEDEEEVQSVAEEGDGGAGGSGVKPPARMLFKRKLMRKKFRSGFDYIKKKKKKEPVSDKKPATLVTPAAAASISVPPSVPRYVSEIHAEIKGWIVNKGHGETVLHRAARLGVNDVVGYCMEKLEYAPSVADNAGYTPLHEACSQGHYHIAKLLLLFGADVSASAQGGIRPLHEAVENGDVHLVRLLLSYGADPHLATYSGQSPLSLATDKQTRMLLEHHVNDVQGYGSASVWNFDDSTLTREPEDVDRLLWSLPPAPSPAPTDDGPSFEFEFSDQSLPDVYKLPSDGGADDRKAAGVDDDDWVLFADVSTALSVKTAEALAKLLDDENAVTAVPADRFNERAVLRKSLGRQPVAVPATGAAANKSSAAERPSKDKDDDSVATKEAPSTTSSTSASISTSSTAAATTTTTTSSVSSSSSTSGGEQILMVRYDRKLKQLLGVDVYTVS